MKRTPWMSEAGFASGRRAAELTPPPRPREPKTVIRTLRDFVIGLACLIPAIGLIYGLGLLVRHYGADCESLRSLSNQHLRAVLDGLWALVELLMCGVVLWWVGKFVVIAAWIFIKLVSLLGEFAAMKVGLDREASKGKSA